MVAPKIPRGLEDAFTTALATEREHMAVGRELIAQAMALMSNEELDVDSLAKAAMCLEKGTKIESRAHEQIIKLTRTKPVKSR